MKLRKGFVSNSSSSSFVCDLCGGAEELYESCFEGSGMSQCTEGHVWHDECFKVGSGDDDKVDPKDCPICSMKEFTTSNVLDYLVIKSGKTLKQIEDDIRKEFTNYDLLCEYLKRRG